MSQAATPGFVALHAPQSAHAKVVPLDMRALGGAMLCQRDAFLASLGEVTVTAALTKRVSAGLFGGEGFILQRLEGSGLAFISAAGTLVQKTLAPGESVLVDAGCLVALQPSVDYDVRYVGSVRRALFAGEGVFMARLDGGASGGLVVLQSYHEHGSGRVAGRTDACGASHRRVLLLVACREVLRRHDAELLALCLSQGTQHEQQRARLHGADSACDGLAVSPRAPGAVRRGCGGAATHASAPPPWRWL